MSPADCPSVKLPKSFVAINLSEKVPDAFGERRATGNGKAQGKEEGEGEGEGEGEEGTW